MTKTKQAPKGARKTTKAATEQSETAQAYAGTPAYSAETASDVKRTLYLLTEQAYRHGREVTDSDRKAIKEGVDGLVDGITRTDPKLVYGLQAALVVEAASRAGLDKDVGRHYINALAAQLAERAGLSPYEDKAREEAGPQGGKGYGMPPDLANILGQYFGRGQPQGPQSAYKPH